MLLLTAPPEGTPGRFLDHLEPGVRHQLPAGLRLATDADGTPRFQLVRHRSTERGGFVHLELGFDRGPAQAPEGCVVRQVGFDRARFRLRRAGGDPLGPWQHAFPSGALALAATADLDHRAVQILDDALSGGVEIAYEAQYPALVPGVPALVVANPAGLRARLAAALPADPAPADAVTAAVLGLPDDVLAVQHLGAPAPRADVLAELAHRVLLELFERATTDPWTEPLYRIAGDAPDTDRVWDVLAPRRTRRTWRATWSIGDLFAGLTPEQRAVHFPRLSDVDPFAEVPVTVINSVPIDPRSVRSLRVDAAFTGPNGARDRRSLTLDPARPIERFTAHYPRFTDDFALEADAVASLAGPPGAPWPVRVGPVALDTADHVIRVTPDALGVSVVRAEADPGFFALAASAEVTLSRAGAPVAAARLTDGEPAAALVVAGTEPLDATVEALETGGQRVVVARHHGAPAIRVPASAVQVTAPDEITVRLTDAAATLPYLALTLTDPAGHTRTLRLEGTAPIRWPCWRTSVFAPLAYTYRLAYVATGPDGRTRPMATTAPRLASAPELIIGTPEV